MLYSTPTDDQDLCMHSFKITVPGAVRLKWMQNSIEVLASTLLMYASDEFGQIELFQVF